MIKEIAKLISVAVFAAVVATQFTPRIQTTKSYSAYDHVMESHQLRCGYINYPPYFEMDVATHQPKGIFADLMQDIGSRMGVDVIWAGESSWAAVTEDLKTHRFDAICSAIWQNSKRALQADFSSPVGYAPIGAWVRAGDARFASSLEAINNPEIRVSVMDGETGEILMQQKFPKAHPISLPQTASFSDLLLNVVTRKADVVFVENRIAADFLQQNPGTLVPATPKNTLSAYPITILLPQDHDQRLKTAIDGALSEILYSGKMKEILRINGAEGDFILPNLPFSP